MTSALEGGGGHGKADKGNRGCVNVTGEGVKKSENFADIIYGRNLTTSHAQHNREDCFQLTDKRTLAPKE